MELKYTFEIKKVSSRKTASLDVEYDILLRTDDPRALELGTVDGSQLVECTFKPVEDV